MQKNSATLVIQVVDRTEIERLLAILHLGLCTAIEQGFLPITSAEDYLYSPYTLEQLETLGVSPQSLRLVHLGTELEDVASLLPENCRKAWSRSNKSRWTSCKHCHTAPPPNTSGCKRCRLQPMGNLRQPR